MSASMSSFVKQAAILAAAGLFVRFIGFLYRLPLTDLLGDEGNGIYGKAYTIYIFLLILSSAGLPAAISKMVSERIAMKQYENAHRVFKVSLLFSGLTGLAATLFLWFGAEWLANAVDTPSSKYAILALAPTVLIVGIMSSFRGYFQGMKNTTPTAVSQIVEQLFNAVFSIFLAYVLISRGIEYASAGGTAGTGIGALAGLAVIWLVYVLLKPDIHKRIRRTKKMFNTPVESNRKIAKELLFTALPIIAGTAIFSITNIIDMKMVSFCLMKTGMYTTSQVDALYGQLTGKYVVLVTLPVSIAAALATAVVPNIAALRVTNNHEELHVKINLALKLTMLFTVPAAVGIGALGGPILRLLFPNHPDGGILLTVGAISVVFLALAQIATGMLQGMNMLAVPAIAAFVGGILKIPVNYFLISDPKINIVGAVISTIVCYAAASCINLYMLVRTTHIKLEFKSIFVKPVVASAVMGVSCLAVYYLIYMVLPINNLACIAAIVVGALVYLIYMLLMGGITQTELRYVPGGNKFYNICKKYGWL